ncbi:WAPL family protein [Aspergillus clavatus NRRL 1]|uniref:Wings apart-like protein C-terminal domain-containing protein n=1 Tax=Aspergillus clavatus (strain ATCC 1007 / CBS 513.65 / DSM 816 / NCTC 3887 / NRRL 1 / QM 1276 / 107) TaxID=344612 RepID=A1C4P0_ASPCL|nr:uncharacterized protein ACLA_000690 [Aspergillus clavatus NRRL 1]EAW14658.1 conserved hypothetical protein [Aspergillus clavatus NRRL 1]
MPSPQNPKRKEHAVINNKRRKFDTQQMKNSHDHGLDTNGPVGPLKPKTEKTKASNTNSALACAVIRSGSDKNFNEVHTVSPSSPDLHQSDIHPAVSAEVPIEESCEHHESDTLTGSSSHIGNTPNRKEVSSRRRLVDALSAMEHSGRGSLVNSETDGDTEACLLPQYASKKNLSAGTRPNIQSRRSAGWFAGDTASKSSISIPSGLGDSRITYARQRSFLNDAHILGGSQHQDTPNLPASYSNRGLRQLAHENSPNITPQLGDDIGGDGPVRGIHELRQAGENSRFQSVIDSIFEDIEDSCNSTSGKCSSFIQLCEKLLDPHLVRCFSEHDFHERLLRCMAGDLDYLSASFALCACRLSRVYDVVSQTLLTRHWSNVLNLSCLLILHVGSDRPLLSATLSAGVSRPIRQTVKNIQPRLSFVISGEDPHLIISPRSIALFSIQSCLTKFRDGASNIESMPAPLLKALVELLLQQKKGTMAAASLPPEEFRTLVLTLSILESYAILSKPDGHSQNYPSLRLLPQLHHFLRFNQCEKGRQLRTHYIRTILNFTNRDFYLSNEYSTPEMVGGLVEIAVSQIRDASEEELSGLDDSLSTSVLALGVLINLTEKSELARSMFLRPTSGSLSYIQLLLDIFFGMVHPLRNINQDIAIGYLSILLLTLCLSAEAVTQVRESQQNNGLTIISSTADEFLRYHQKIEPWSKTQERGNLGPMTRLEYIIRQVKQSTS